MRLVPDDRVDQDALNRICEDKLFARSTRNVRLLKFLVQKALEGADVSEYVIGVELFNRSYEPEKNDSKVRVYMYNLRKKLDEYYQAGGKNAPVVFQIEKGQYNLRFVLQASKQPDEDQPNVLHEKQSRRRPAGIWGWMTAGVLMVLLLLVLGLNYFPDQKENYCWEPFFTNHEDNICVVADHFLVSIPLPNYPRRIMTYLDGVNNTVDMHRYIDHHQADSFRSSDFTLLTKMAPITASRLTRWFMANGSDFEITIDSEFDYQQAREKNILYIGQFKSMNKTEAIFLKNSKVFKAVEDGFTYTVDGGTTNYQSGTVGNSRTDYAIVSYAPHDEQHTVLFFASNNDIGTLATTRQFIDRNWLQQFYKQLPSPDAYFNALFEVKGIKRTDITCRLIHLEVIE